MVFGSDIAINTAEIIRNDCISNVVKARESDGKDIGRYYRASRSLSCLTPSEVDSSDGVSVLA